MEKTMSVSDIRKAIEQQLQELEGRYRNRFHLAHRLHRAQVSFQQNRKTSTYRWFHYKEGFSSSLVTNLLTEYRLTGGKILDPFAGSGTTLFACRDQGVDSEGIELLPVGQEIIRARILLEDEMTGEHFQALAATGQRKDWKTVPGRHPLAELNITRGAYPPHIRDAMEQYLAFCQEHTEPLRTVLRFVLLCVLETISYTRKDGQYLRWDYRAGRRSGEKPFDKGPLADFDRAIQEKIQDICRDAGRGAVPGQTAWLPGYGDAPRGKGSIRLHCGSCFDILPTLEEETCTAIITSPPYCNRYDYTRIYALELALLGADELQLKALRQNLLSCTVENRDKDLLRIKGEWALPLRLAGQQPLLASLLDYLHHQKQQGQLNNSGIPRMVKNYFAELAIVVFESARLLRPDGHLFMVNDNVRYAGVSIPVDLILADLAEAMGLQVVSILVLPETKGNSSQQMKIWGRAPLRKCVYVWRKP